MGWILFFFVLCFFLHAILWYVYGDQFVNVQVISTHNFSCSSLTSVLFLCCFWVAVQVSVITCARGKILIRSNFFAAKSYDYDFYWFCLSSLSLAFLFQSLSHSPAPITTKFMGGYKVIVFYASSSSDFPFSTDQVRVLLFRECETPRLLFDSDSIQHVDRSVRSSNPPGGPGRKNGVPLNGNIVEISDGIIYKVSKICQNYLLCINFVRIGGINCYSCV